MNYIGTGSTSAVDGLVKSTKTSAVTTAQPGVDYVTPSDTEILTNKTLINPVINGFTGDSSAINIGPGQIVKNTAGNVGIGVTPNAWHYEIKGIDFGSTGSIVATNSTTIFSSNLYLDGAGWHYKTSGAYASKYTQSGGQHRWETTSDAGVATANATLTESMVLSNTGQLGIGKQPAANLDYRKTPVIVNASTGAVASKTHVLISSVTLTLPASPLSGDWIEIVNRSGTTTCVIARNSSNIMGLAQDMTLDDAKASFVLVYADGTRGWVII